MFIGVTMGFTKSLNLTGIGYKATIIESKDNFNNKDIKILNLQLGFSHPINLEIPKNIYITLEDNYIHIYSSSLTNLNKFLTKIYRLRPANKSYKGTGLFII